MIKKPRFESFPWLVRQGAVAALGWRNQSRRFGGEYKRWMEFLRESNEWNSAERIDWQRRQLLSLIDLARTGTDYYAQILPSVEEVEALKDLEKLLHRIPVLQKQDLRSHPEDFRNRQIRETVVTSTSGSTGSPMRVGHDDLSIQRRFAFLKDHLRLAGVKMGDPPPLSH